MKRVATKPEDIQAALRVLPSVIALLKGSGATIGQVQIVLYALPAALAVCADPLGGEEVRVKELLDCIALNGLPMLDMLRRLGFEGFRNAVINKVAAFNAVEVVEVRIEDDHVCDERCKVPIH